MVTSPLVSVIMPVFNCERYVRAAIQSILSQEYTNLELLICNDGSTDNSLKEIRKFSDKRIRLFINKNNVGSLATRNYLLTQAKGFFIAMQDADDISMPQRLSKQVDSF